MKDVSWLSDLKFRGSYGITGNAGGIDPYQSLATVASGGGYNINHTYFTAIRPSGISNPDLRWEKTYQVDAGVELGLFNNRLTLEMDVYRKLTTDMLLTQGTSLTKPSSSWVQWLPVGAEAVT